jgi:hypothetical protein
MKTQKAPPEYSKQADKFLIALDRKTEQRIKRGIEDIPNGDIIPYKAAAGYFKHTRKGYKYGLSSGNPRIIQIFG